MANDISLYCKDDALIITIAGVLYKEKPTAIIISASGETVKRFDLKQGKNSINIAGYDAKNYSVRIQNGSNVLVQKIGR